MKAAVDGLWARHEALAAKGILTPLVFCRRNGQAIRTFWKRWTTACDGGRLSGSHPARLPPDGGAELESRRRT